MEETELVLDEERCVAEEEKEGGGGRGQEWKEGKREALEECEGAEGER